MNNDDATNQTMTEHKPRPMLDLLLSLVIPTLILMNLSGEEDLGPMTALIVALAFPIGWGLFELVRFRHFNFIALLGLISVILTGGIGLLELDPQWLAIKEASIPALIGLVVLLSTYTRYPLVRTFVYSPKIFHVERIQQRLEERGNSRAFDARLNLATYLLSGTFLFSSVMNYVLAKAIVTSAPGTAAFNEELGRMTLLSYPVISIPAMLMMIGILYYLWRTVCGLTGFKLEEVLVNAEASD